MHIWRAVSVEELGTADTMSRQVSQSGKRKRRTELSSTISIWMIQEKNGWFALGIFPAFHEKMEKQTKRCIWLTHNILLIKQD